MNTLINARRASVALALGVGLAGFGAGAVAAQSTISTFTGGDLDGWVGSSGPAGGVGTYVDVESGTPAPSLRTQFNDFGITFANQSDAWTGDFTQAGFTISTDIYSRQVFFFSMDVTRDWILDLTATPGRSRCRPRRLMTQTTSRYFRSAEGARKTVER